MPSFLLCPLPRDGGKGEGEENERCSMAERVWDHFLTEQDKATLVNKPPRPIGFGERPALLLDRPVSVGLR